MAFESPLRQRDGRLPPCTVILWQISRGLQLAASFRIYAHANVLARALNQAVTQHARLWRVRAELRWLESVHAL